MEVKPSAMDDDYEIAFKLQFDEVLEESAIDSAATSSPENADSVPGGGTPSKILEEELLEHYRLETSMKAMRLDIGREMHDRAFAFELNKLLSNEQSTKEHRKKMGENFNRPYGEESTPQGWAFCICVKGLADETVGGIGVSILDGSNTSVFELGKTFDWNGAKPNYEVIELKALIEGLEIAVSLELRTITIVSDNPCIFDHITGTRLSNIKTLSDQIELLLRRFTSFGIIFPEHEEMEPVSNIARKAIHAWGGSRNVNVGTESCSICLEAACSNFFYEIPPCLHRYCKQCLSKHVQFKLLQGLLPKCPYEDCSSELMIDDCQKFLTDDWVEIMKDRLKEAAIPPKEKLYCPYSTCSTLLSMSEIRSQRQRQSPASSSNDARQSGATKCPKCRNYFCSSCKVPWHDNLSCSEFKELDQVTEADEKLQALATQKMWRQCPECSQLISLDEGCYHMHCRCGHQFCYTCGAEWIDKKASCSCPLWDEDNIEYE